MATPEFTRAIMLMASPIDMPATEVDPLRAILLLVVGLAFLAGFAIGISVEQYNLAVRERQLVRRRRLLGAQARGLRQQLLNFYRMRDSMRHAEPPSVVDTEFWHEW